MNISKSDIVVTVDSNEMRALRKVSKYSMYTFRGNSLMFLLGVVSMYLVSLPAQIFKNLFMEIYDSYEKDDSRRDSIKQLGLIVTFTYIALVLLLGPQISWIVVTKWQDKSPFYVTLEERKSNDVVITTLENTREEGRKLIMADPTLNDKCEKEESTAGKGGGPDFAQVSESVSKGVESTPGSGSCSRMQDSVQVLMKGARLWSVAPPSLNPEIAAIWMNGIKKLASAIEYGRREDQQRSNTGLG